MGDAGSLLSSVEPFSAQEGLHSELRELAHRHRKISESVASPLI